MFEVIYRKSKMNWGYRLNIAGFGKSMRKKRLLQTRSERLFSVWFGDTSLLPQVLQTWSASSPMEALLPLTNDHRSSVLGEKLDQILFLRENALMENFDLGWL